MKRRLCALGLALMLSLTACGRDTDGQTESSPSPENTANSTESGLGGTYWTAVRLESEDESTGEAGSSALPSEERWADLWLNADGSVLYRDVRNCFYVAEIRDGRWQQEGSTLCLTASDPNATYSAIDGYLEGEQLVLEYNSQRLYLEQAEQPAPGGELCVADMQGTWKQTGVREDSMAACLSIDEHWVDWGSGYQPTATLYIAEGLDYYVPEYRRYEDLELEVLDKGIEGTSNQCWSLRLYNEDVELLATMTKLDTVYLQDANGQLGVFKRVGGLLPDEVLEAMEELPSDTTIFYWDDPGEAIIRQMDFWPLVKLERSCINRVLIVSRWADMQVRIYSGTPQMNADGRMEKWLIDELAYETTLGIDEPLWLAMNTPEETAELCLFFRLPGEEVWRTWPFTEQEPYCVKGHTYFVLN